MADREPTTEDILAFMDEGERRDWDSGKGTPEERAEIWEALKELWRSIPDPTDEQLKPPLMRDDEWFLCQTEPRAREGILNFYRRKWKKDRKAAARKAKVDALPSREEKGRFVYSPKHVDEFWERVEKAQETKPADEGDAKSDEKPGVNLFDLARRIEADQKANPLVADADLLRERQKAFYESMQKMGEDIFKQSLDQTKSPFDSLSQPGLLEPDISQVLAEQAEARRKDDQQATARAIEQAIHKALRQNKESEEPKVEMWAEIRKNRGWYIPAFLLSGLPIYVATLWGPIVGSKTVPEWLAEHGWPRLTTLVIAWASGIALIALVIIVRSFLTARRRRELLASQRTSVSFKLTGLTLDRYDDDDTQIMLARFKYSTGVGHSPKVEVKANLTVFDATSVRLPEYAGVWHGSIVRSKRFSAGDSGDLVVGLVNNDGMVGYEYHVSKVGGVTLNANLTEVPGKEFYVQAVFIARTRTDDDIVLFETTQWFKVEAGAKPRFIGTTQPSQFW